jgi:twinkle protein
MTKLRSLVEETGIGLLLVSHLRRPSGDKGHEDGREVSLSHLRGSASIAHLSDSVIALERNQQADDPVEANTTTLRILKNRYTGDTGIATHLHYDNQTGRMTQIDNPFVENEDNQDIPF